MGWGKGGRGKGREKGGEGDGGERVEGVPSRTILDRTYSAQRFFIFS